MAGFNILKERIYTFEDAAKEIGWDTDTLLRKAVEGSITPLVYVEWEGEPLAMPDPILTPEGKAEWKRLVDEGITMGFAGFCRSSPPSLFKGLDWLTIEAGAYHPMLTTSTSVDIVSAYLFSHSTFPAPPKGHRWLIIFGNNNPLKISEKNLSVRASEINRINALLMDDEEGNQKKVWKIPVKVEFAKLRNLFQEFADIGIFDPESLQHLYEHFNERSIREPVPSNAKTLKWEGESYELKFLLRTLKNPIDHINLPKIISPWIDSTEKELEQNHFMLKGGKAFRIYRMYWNETDDLSEVESILKKHLS